MHALNPPTLRPAEFHRTTLAGIYANFSSKSGMNGYTTSPQGVYNRFPTNAEDAK